jgi:hypothetical protein
MFPRAPLRRFHLTRILVVTIVLVMPREMTTRLDVVTDFDVAEILRGIQRECRNLRQARDTARAFRKSAVEALHRDDPTWAENYRRQVAHAWTYVAIHREALAHLRVRKAKVMPLRPAKRSAA